MQKVTVLFLLFHSVFFITVCVFLFLIYMKFVLSSIMFFVGVSISLSLCFIPVSFLFRPSGARSWQQLLCRTLQEPDGKCTRVLTRLPAGSAGRTHSRGPSCLTVANKSPRPFVRVLRGCFGYKLVFVFSFSLITNRTETKYQEKKFTYLRKCSRFPHLLLCLPQYLVL